MLLKNIPSPSEHSKLAPRWNGPFEVANVDRFPVIQINFGTPDNPKLQNWHHDHLKPCKLNAVNEYLKHFPPLGTFPRKEITLSDNLPMQCPENDNQQGPSCHPPSGEDPDADDNLAGPLAPNLEGQGPENVRSPDATARYDLRPQPKFKIPYSM